MTRPRLCSGFRSCNHRRMASEAADPNDRLRRRATLASVAVAGILIFLKLGAYTVTGSVALLSSLIDSSVDAFASIVTLVGVRYALQPADTTPRDRKGTRLNSSH